jgi:hypothetical protein
MKENRRKLIKLIPDAKKQKLQIKYACLIVASCFVLAVLMLGLFLVNSMLLDHFCWNSKNYISLTPLQWGLVAGFFLVIFGYIALLSVSVINLSHRLIGPLYRIESIIKEALETGKAPAIKLRKNDELQDTVELLNRFFEDPRFKRVQ